MAMDKEFLGQFIQGDSADEAIGKILSEHDAAIVGLKRNNEALVGEKKKLTESFEALGGEKKNLEAKIAELDEKIKAGLPDQQKQAYEADIEKYKSEAARISDNMTRQLAEKDGLIENMKKEQHDYICKSEFSKLLDSEKLVYPELREQLTKTFFLDHSFEWVEQGGEKQLRDQNSRLMSDILKEFLNTPTGMHFKMDASTGGGAIGSRGHTGGGLTATRQQYEAMAARQQSEFIAKGGKIAS